MTYVKYRENLYNYILEITKQTKLNIFITFHYIPIGTKTNNVQISLILGFIYYICLLLTVEDIPAYLELVQR